MQVGLSQHNLDEYFSIVKEFMLEIHQRIGEGHEVPEIESQLLSVIDRASVKIKTQREQIAILQLQLKESDLAKISFKQVRSECSHLQKRLAQKGDEISILRETVKTLYQDNERISNEKEGLAKQFTSLKESASGLKKRLKRQEDDISTHKHQLRKLTAATQDKLGEYLKEDEHKQALIKKQAHDSDRLKSDLHKKEKSMNASHRKLEELKNIQQDCDKLLRLAETLKEENNLLMTELQKAKEKHLEEKGRWLAEVDAFKNVISELKEKAEEKKYQIHELSSKFRCAEEKMASYEGEIVMRTEKLKEKSKQVKLYSEEIGKLSARVEELSEMSDEVLADNQELTDKCHGLQQRLEQLRAFQAYVARVKGDISNKKSQELGKLMQSLTKLHGHA